MDLGIVLTTSRAKALSTICADIAQVFFATSIGTIVLPLDSSRILVVVLYLSLSLLFWFLSIRLAEKGKL